MKRVSIGDDLTPYLGKRIEIRGVVSNTKAPSFGEGWITVWALEDHREQEVRVTGVVRRKEESAFNEEGEIVQGRDGLYFHLEDVKLLPLT